MPPPPRRWVFRLVAVFAGLLALEATARILEAATPDRTLPTPADPFDRQFVRDLRDQRAAAGEDLRMVAEDPRSWALAPESTVCMGGLVPLRVNRLGMRGPELGPRAEAEVRLLSLGDSSCFGHGVAEERVMTEIAAARLGDRWGRSVRSVNGCVPGYDSAQSLATLEGFGDHVEPDWVVVSCLWSDLYAPGREGDPRASGGPLAGALDHAATYRVLARWLAPWTRPRKVRWIASRGDVGDATAPRAEAGARIDLAAYLANLRAIAAESRRIGARTAFVVLPAPLDFDEVRPPAAVAEYREGMRLVAAEAGEPLVDGPALFAARGLGVEGFLDKVHPAVAGHAALGEALAEALAAEPEPASRPAVPGTPASVPDALPFEELLPGCRPEEGRGGAHRPPEPRRR
jgi:lysophospholipase L1-like esterase